MSKERWRGPEPFAFEEATRIAREVALKYGGHVPVLIAEGSRRSFGGQIANFPDTHEDRVRWMLSAGYALAQSGEVGELQQVTFISEGWMSAGEARSPESRPSQDPDRKEVLLVSSLVIKGHRNRLVVFEMGRDADGKLTELKDLQLPGEYEEGRTRTPLLDAFADGFYMGIIDPGTTPA
jgi:hypothetical protein